MVYFQILSLMLYTRDREKQEEAATAQPEAPSEDQTKEGTTSGTDEVQNPLAGLDDHAKSCFQVGLNW